MHPIVTCLRYGALSTLLSAGFSHAQIFKCEAADGKVEYRAAPCAATDKAKEIPVPKGSAPKPAAAPTSGTEDAAQAGQAAMATPETPDQKPGGCAELEKRLKANALAIRDTLDSWHREMTVFGKDSPRTRGIFNKLSNLRIDRTMLAQNAYPSCDFARRGIYPRIASGKPIPEEIESGLSDDTIRKCDAMRTEIVALRAKTGRYPGAGRPGLWIGEVDSPMAKELVLEDRMNSMRCPQFGPPMSMPR